MKSEFYTQCRLVNGTVHTTAFIPSKHAVVGKQIVINKVNEWTVSEVYERVELSDIKDQSHDSKKIWAATSGSFVIGHK